MRGAFPASYFLHPQPFFAVLAGFFAAGFFAVFFAAAMMLPPVPLFACCYVRQRTPLFEKTLSNQSGPVNKPHGFAH
jgi:hypothetical protein